MFPNAWPLRENDKYKLNQHWFARNLAWDYKINQSEVIMTLSSNDQTKKLYSHDFLLNTVIRFLSEEKIEIVQKITNIWNDLLPIALWLHPHYYVHNNEKEKLMIYLWNELLKDYSFCEWSTVYLDNPIDIKLIYPNQKIIKLNYSKEYEKLWIWSEKWKDFICIEPVYSNEQALLDNPKIVKKGESVEYRMIVEGIFS